MNSQSKQTFQIYIILIYLYVTFQNKPHKCSWCTRSFPTPGELRAHVATHTGPVAQLVTRSVTQTVAQLVARPHAEHIGKHGELWSYAISLPQARFKRPCDGIDK